MQSSWVTAGEGLYQFCSREARELLLSVGLGWLFFPILVRISLELYRIRLAYFQVQYSSGKTHRKSRTAPRLVAPYSGSIQYSDKYGDPLAFHKCFLRPDQGPRHVKSKIHFLQIYFPLSFGNNFNRETI